MVYDNKRGRDVVQGRRVTKSTLSAADVVVWALSRNLLQSNLLFTRDLGTARITNHKNINKFFSSVRQRLHFLPFPSITEDTPIPEEFYRLWFLILMQIDNLEYKSGEGLRRDCRRS